MPVTKNEVRQSLVFRALRLDGKKKAGLEGESRRQTLSDSLSV